MPTWNVVLTVMAVAAVSFAHTVLLSNHGRVEQDKMVIT